MDDTAFYFSKKPPNNKVYYDFLQHDNPWLCFSGYDTINSIIVPRKHNTEDHDYLYIDLCFLTCKCSHPKER